VLRASLLTVFALIAGCGSSGDTPANDAGVDSTTDVPEEAAIKPEGTADFTLLTLTAWQGQLEPLTVSDGKTATALGGFPVLSAYFKEERAAAKDDVLLVTGGDEFGATPVLSSVFDDEPAIKALDFLGLRATTFGNHNFDLGVSRLKEIINTTKYTFVTSNLTNVQSELGSKVAVPYFMIEVGTALPKPKVAILGLSAPSLLAIQFPGKFGSIGIEEPVAAANKAVTAARNAGASAVVALVHAGADKVDAAGNPSGQIVDLAKAVSGVDVWVADHTDLKVNATINNGLIVQNRKRGQGYGVVKVKIVDGKVTLKSATLKDAIGTVAQVFPAGAACMAPTECASGACDAGKCAVSCPSTACSDGFTCNSGACQKIVKAADAEAEAILEPFRKALPEKFDVKLAVIDQEYKRGGSPQIERVGETPLGDLVADALLKRTEPLGAKIAMVNGGGIRNPLPGPYAPVDKTLRRTAVGYASGPPYDLVVGDIFNMHPYSNAAVVRKVRGSTLWLALEHGLSFIPAANGAFPQIAGFKVVYDASAPPLSRVISVTLDDGTVVPKDDAKELSLATVDFINAGGDGYSMLVEAVPSPTLDLLTTIMIDYLKSVTPVPAPKGGRLLPKI
jgi:5'-nucleotidase